MNENRLPIIAIVISLVIGILLFFGIRSTNKTVVEGNKIILTKVVGVDKKVTVIDSTVNVIDTLKIPRLVKEVKLADEKADKAQKSANWANSRISGLEKENEALKKENEKIFSAIDSLLKSQVVAEDNDLGEDDEEYDEEEE